MDRYRITAKHSGKCLDIPFGSGENGVNLQQYTQSKGLNQLFILTPVYFRIIAKHSGKCLDIPFGSKENGVNIQQYTWHGGDNQLFRIEKVGDYYRIVAKHSNKCLSIPESSLENGKNLQQYTWQEGNNQLFTLLPAFHYLFNRNQNCKIIAKHSGKCLDISQASIKDKAQAIQWGCHEKDNQIFDIVPVYYRISPVTHPNKCLDISHGSKEDNAQVLQWSWHEGDNQLFRLERVIKMEVGIYYRIIAKHSGKCFTIPQERKEDQVSVQQYGCHGKDSQLFVFENNPTF